MLMLSLVRSAVVALRVNIQSVVSMKGAGDRDRQRCMARLHVGQLVLGEDRTAQLMMELFDA